MRSHEVPFILQGRVRSHEVPFILQGRVRSHEVPFILQGRLSLIPPFSSPSPTLLWACDFKRPLGGGFQTGINSSKKFLDCQYPTTCWIDSG